jgi:hypothetical protein
MVNIDSERLFLTRKEAAAYLSQRYFKISAATLARYAVDGTGPLFTSAGGLIGNRTYYTRENLDSWARAYVPVIRTPASGALSRG